MFKVRQLKHLFKLTDIKASGIKVRSAIHDRSPPPFPHISCNMGHIKSHTGTER